MKYASGLFYGIKRICSTIKLKGSVGYKEHQSSLMMTSERERLGPKEIQIPLPYGHMAVKDWGPPDGLPLLALHGWLDNAGSFDTLIPLLLPNLRVIALDLPGHGLSSHKPPGSIYEFVHFLIDVKRVIEFYEWKKITIIGHSLGCGLAVFFASLYPNLVDCVIGIDLIKPVATPVEKITRRAAEAIDQHLLLEKKCSQEPPVYTQDQALQRLIDGLQNQVTEKSAKILMKRGTRLSSDGKGLIFTRDIHARKISLFNFDIEQQKLILSHLKCELLIIKAKEGPWYEDREILKDFLDLYARNSKRFQFTEVEGSHFVHLNNPERISPIINTFISKRLLENKEKL
ncbi:serine hydrolase-like protein isoform X2 [Tachypleus tridentatus]|uniref:serine hydrolase-like protein isoform X2 n=1 Tax=Tachypleus tridentatus TaxID=6853 RepID=UPI003FD68DA2